MLLVRLARANVDEIDLIGEQARGGRQMSVHASVVMRVLGQADVVPAVTMPRPSICARVGLASIRIQERPWQGNHQFMNPEFVGAFDGNWVGGGFAEAPCSQPGPKPKPTECDPRWYGRTYASMFWYNGTLPEPAPPEYPLWFDREGMGGRNQIVRGSYVSRDDAADPNADVDAAVHGNGIDLSVRFLTNQKKFGPLPGMNLGYFGGATPDIGAVQFVE